MIVFQILTRPVHVLAHKLPCTWGWAGSIITNTVGGYSFGNGKLSRMGHLFFSEEAVTLAHYCHILSLF